MLRAGATKNPQLGGCLVQIANWLADPTIWTDKPAHVHPVLAAWAIKINDVVCLFGTNENRGELALLAPRLTGTGKTGRYEMSYFFQEEELNLWLTENPFPFIIWPTIAQVDMTEGITWLSALLDVFDRVTGRARTPELSPERWAEVRQLVCQ